jgi:hypothetical protein
VPVPKPKGILETIIDVEAWHKLLGLDENQGGRV